MVRYGEEDNPSTMAKNTFIVRGWVRGSDERLQRVSSVAGRKQRRPTFFTIIPPRLWAMKMMGASFQGSCSRSASSVSNNMAPSSSMSVTSLLKAVLELYPYDRTLADGISVRRKSLSQNAPLTAVQVRALSPPSPCTATMLSHVNIRSSRRYVALTRHDILLRWE
jgi:hypothetical protein